jgi:hypothetical protein
MPFRASELQSLSDEPTLTLVTDVRHVAHPDTGRTPSRNLLLPVPPSTMDSVYLILVSLLVMVVCERFLSYFTARQEVK